MVLPVPSSSSPPAVTHVEVDEAHDGQRLDNFLLGKLKGVPRSHIYRLIRSGQVRVNKGRSSASYRLKPGDTVRVPPVRHRQPAPQAEGGREGLAWLERRIIAENDRFIVLDKPSGLAVHGGSGLALGCIEAIRSLRPDIRSLELAHRLDRMTSGCLLIAKKRSALRILHRLFREGLVNKRYLALVRGDWQHGTLTVDVPLAAAPPGGRAKVRVQSDGKASSSEFRLIERFDGKASLVEVRIDTGRTHQIRVHAAHVGHPIAGDERYGDDSFNRHMEAAGLRRLFLHAHTLAFDWPDTDESFSFSAPLPDDLKRALDHLQVSRP